MGEADQGRWERLFVDLEDQAAALAELGEVRLYDRLRAAVGQSLTLTVCGPGMVAGTLREAGPDWLLLVDSFDRESLVAGPAVTSVGGLGRHSAAPGSEGRVAARLTLRWALRRLARDRSEVAVFLTDGSQLSGTVDRVGADFVELAEHLAGEARRASTVRGVRALPLHALAVLRRT
jgi:hypothetical protein